MHYRIFVPDDFSALYSIEKLCFEPPLRFTRRYMRELIESSASTTWIALDESMMTGFAILNCLTDSEGTAAYIQTIEVAPPHRHRGIGSQLLDRLESSAQAALAPVIWLHVDARNEKAIRLYQRSGFRQPGRQEHYYARNRAAVIYAKALKPEPAR